MTIRFAITFKRIITAISLQLVGEMLQVKGLL